ncbi:hypothetical protein L0Y59_01960 [Candidatus Uhrbacteria bacterium]|nr:hypothetical protein [Candidatus Uhrbacteria bacterium]
MKAATVTVDAKTGLAHLPHRAAPGATEYRGIPIHIKGRDRKLEKLLKKSSPKKPDEPSDEKPEKA